MNVDDGFLKFVSLFPSLYDGGEYICKRFKATDYSVGAETTFSELSGTMFDVLVLAGTMRVVIDNTEFVCTREQNNYFDCKPMNIVSDLRFSNDFDGYLIIVSKEMMDYIGGGKKPMLGDFIALRSKPAMTLANKQFQMLRYYAEQTDRSTGREDNIFAEQITQAWLKIFLSESLNIIFSSGLKRDFAPANSKEDICNRFSALLMQDVVEHHDVAYYADKLCITPRYLSMITKDVLGIPAGDVIDNDIIAKANVLLRSNLSLKEIADQLHFSDQSSFGKFFKKHTGQTPATYRAKLPR